MTSKLVGLQLELTMDIHRIGYVEGFLKLKLHIGQTSATFSWALEEMEQLLKINDDDDDDEGGFSTKNTLLDVQHPASEVSQSLVASFCGWHELQIAPYNFICQQHFRHDYFWTRNSI